MIDNLDSFREYTLNDIVAQISLQSNNGTMNLPVNLRNHVFIAEDFGGPDSGVQLLAACQAILGVQYRHVGKYVLASLSSVSIFMYWEQKESVIKGINIYLLIYGNALCS